MSLDPLLTWLRAGQPTAHRLDFPVGTALPGGRLDLCKSGIGPDGARRVVEALPPGGVIRHLLLGTDGLGDHGATAAAEGALAGGASTLYLGCNAITPVGACSLTERLAASPGVVRGLWLKRNPIGPRGLAAVAALVATEGAPSTLDLVQTGITALDGLPAALAGSGVRRLFLSGNALGPDPQLPDLVARGGLEELYLSAARLGDDGAALLTAGLGTLAANPSRPRLLRLSVASNGIGPEALVALVGAAGAAGVQVLDLGRVTSAGVLGAADNRLGDAGAAGLAPLRPAHLDLRHTGIGSRGALALLAADAATRYVLGAGIAARVKRALSERAAGLPALVPHPEVAAVRSVHRTVA
ncbi:gala protein [Longispora sp. K20-0274]|uniref:gala protein n=1 Tax=Longispora sp. K20-0274 TaxID=3088255 RepID=UPI00399A378E